MCIASHFANILSHVSLLPTSLTITTNTMLSDEPAQGSNATAVQIFIGHNSMYIDIYRVATDQDLSCTLEQNIRIKELWMYLLAIMHLLLPVRKSKIFFI